MIKQPQTPIFMSSTTISTRLNQDQKEKLDKMFEASPHETRSEFYKDLLMKAVNSFEKNESISPLNHPKTDHENLMIEFQKIRIMQDEIIHKIDSQEIEKNFLLMDEELQKISTECSNFNQSLNFIQSTANSIDLDPVPKNEPNNQRNFLDFLEDNLFTIMIMIILIVFIAFQF